MSSYDHIFLMTIMAAFVLTLLLMLIRVLKGPTVFDRINGLAVIGTNAVILLVIMGMVSGRETMYLDIAMSYSILGFFGFVVIARFLNEEVKRKG